MEVHNLTYLNVVVSLNSASSSEGFRLAVRDTLADVIFVLVAALACLDFAFRDTVLPLSSACRRKSCMMLALPGLQELI